MGSRWPHLTRIRDTPSRLIDGSNQVTSIAPEYELPGAASVFGQAGTVTLGALGIEEVLASQTELNILYETSPHNYNLMVTYFQRIRFPLILRRKPDGTRYITVTSPPYPSLEFRRNVAAGESRDPLFFYNASTLQPMPFYSVKIRQTAVSILTKVRATGT